MYKHLTKEFCKYFVKKIKNEHYIYIFNCSRSSRPQAHIIVLPFMVMRS